MASKLSGVGAWVPRRSRKTLIRLVVGALVVAAMVALVRRFVRLADAIEALAGAEWSLLAPLLLLCLVYYVLKALRWHYYLHVASVPVTVTRSMAAYLAGQWFTFTPAGELMRAYLLGAGTRFSVVAPTVVVQAIVDFLSLALMALLIVPVYPDIAPVVLPVTAPLLVTAVMVTMPPLRRYARTWRAMRWLIGGRAGGVLNGTAQLLTPAPLAVGLLLGVPTVLAGAGALFVAGLAIGFRDWGIAQAVGVYSMIQLLGGVSPLPQGIGVTEGSGTVLLTYLGIDPARALAAILVFRVASLGFSVLLGLAAFAVLRLTDQTLAGASLRGIERESPAQDGGACGMVQ